MTSNISLIIDNHEHALIQNLTEKKQDFVSESLDIGDIIIKTDDEIKIIIERKTIDDLCSSITDGRHREQKMRLLNSSIPVSRILYIIEGDVTRKTNIFTKISQETIISSLINTQFRDNIKVYKTNNINETSDFICKLYKKYMNDPVIFTNTFKPNTEVDYVSTINIKKIKNKTPSVVFMTQLSVIPQLSPVIANCIYEKYRNMRSLIESYNQLESEHEKINMLSNLSYPIKNNKTRKLGPKLSNDIYTYLYY